MPECLLVSFVVAVALGQRIRHINNTPTCTLPMNIIKGIGTWLLKMAEERSISSETVRKVGSVLNDRSHSLAKRFRALFTLRNVGGDAAIEEIGTGFSDSSELLKHELAYCLGQMKDTKAISVLLGVLEDRGQEAMVRHEAGEALGAIGDASVLDTLDHFAKDPVTEVSETCQIAAEKIRWEQSHKRGRLSCKYQSIDPAPACTSGDMHQWSTDLLDPALPLFERYRALFALRDRGGEEAVLQLIRGLNDSSALFKHEIAYVLGQMQHPAAVGALSAKLAETSENAMVRHECAEALGAIATEDCLQVLQKYQKDDERVVRESCEVALDMYQYEHSSDFQYANSISNVIAS